MATMTVGGHLGGHMSFARGVGVNHAFLDNEPEDWTDVAAEGDVPDSGGLKIEHGGAPILLARCGREILAISDRCSHAAGPLHEGDVDTIGCSVKCPWHGSVFSLRDGAVIHGPASVPQSSYEVRLSGDRVEVRKRQPVLL
jgi:nitrite reductase/ring-hydroxylating ferredoxin subunit